MGKPLSKPVKLFLKIFLTVMAIALFGIAIVFIGAFCGLIDTTSGLNINEVQLDFTSIVYCVDPKTGEYEEYEHLYADENRVWVDLGDIPKHVQHAAVAIEDERFYNHKGVDLKSTSKAVFGYVFKRSAARGGSTITQQLIKNLTGEKDKSPIRKMQEMIRAVQLEQKLSKDEILELYLNTIYLSQGCHGIQSAAHFYFGKDASELTVAEGAALVGITQYPTLYDPLINPENNKEKQEIVLAKMYELKYLSKEAYEKAVQEELQFSKGDWDTGSSKQSYFVDEIINQVIKDLMQEYGYSLPVATKMLYSGGLQIYATVDPEVQRIADEVFSNPDNLAAAANGTRPQASMCVMDPYTGEIKALVGGFGEKTGLRTLNRATQSLRQPGSTIKPIAVYAPAIEEGVITTGSVYEDKQLTFDTWTPKNYYAGFKGKMNIRYAVEISVNTVPIQILDEMGIHTSFNYMTKHFHVTSLKESDKNLSSLALGGLTDGMSNMELTAAYASFVNDGVYNTPSTYTKILDSSGNTILEKKQQPARAVSTQTAKVMNGLLKAVCDQGTGTAARFGSGYTIAGKTGTTDDDRDRWFVGYTPYYIAAVWVGYDTPASLSFYRSNPTIPLWKAVMSRVHSEKKLASKSFAYETPPIMEEEDEEELTIYDGMICTESGLKATSACPKHLVVEGDTMDIEDHCNVHAKEEETDVPDADQVPPASSADPVTPPTAQTPPAGTTESTDIQFSHNGL